MSIQTIICTSLSKAARTIAALSVVSCLTAAVSVAHAQQPLKKVKIGVGSLVLNAAMPYVLLPNVLGYWKEEGYDVEVFSAQSSVQAIQLLAAGKVDFIQVNSAPMVQAVVKNKVPLRSVMMSTVIDWSLVAPASSSIKTLQDFKGKLIGVPALGAGGVALLESYFAANGIDPKKDVTMVAVGAGPAALIALNSGRVSGLMFWGSALAGYEAAGAKFNYFFDPQWRKNGDYALATLQSTVAQDPKMVEAIARGVAKASLFAVTSPDCMRRLHWAHYPDHKPSGDEAAAVSLDMLRIGASITAMKSAFENSMGKWGATTPADFKKLEKLFVASNLIDSQLANPADYTIGIPGFYDRVNTFDHAAVVRRAAVCQAT